MLRTLPTSTALGSGIHLQKSALRLGAIDHSPKLLYLCIYVLCCLLKQRTQPLLHKQTTFINLHNIFALFTVKG